MDPKNINSDLKEIFKASLEEAKKKDGDKNKSIDGEEDGKKEEDDEDKKIKNMKKKDENDNEDEDKDKSAKKGKKKEVKEETIAASSLHPAARSISDPKSLSASKVGMMSHVMGMMGGMDKGSMVDFFNKTMSQFGPGKDYGVGDKSDSNKSTLNMKPSNAVGNGGADVKEPMVHLNNPKVKNGVLGVKEDVEEMFSGEELSEEFKEKAATLFEAAISARLAIETARLQEETATTLAEEFNTFINDTTLKINTYLKYVTETWMEDNEVALESTIRNELAEEFMEGLKTLFTEHYINVPQEKVDIVSSMAEKVNVLESQLNDLISENDDLKSNLLDGSKKEVFESLQNGLTLTQQEKFHALSEGIEFDGNLDTYKKKLMIVKETYFKTDQKTVTSNINEETFEGEVEPEKRVNSDPTINRYVEMISKSVKQ